MGNAAVRDGIFANRFAGDPSHWDYSRDESVEGREADSRRIFGLRVTGQVTEKHRVTFSHEHQQRCSGSTLTVNIKLGAGVHINLDEAAKAWLTAVITRRCIDELRSARLRRVEYKGPWLPEPVRTHFGDDPAEATDRAATLTLGFLVVLVVVLVAVLAVPSFRALSGGRKLVLIQQSESGASLPPARINACKTLFLLRKSLVSPPSGRDRGSISGPSSISLPSFRVSGALCHRYPSKAGHSGPRHSIWRGRICLIKDFYLWL